MNWSRQIFNKYPITRGIVTYGFSYATSDLIAQTFFRPEQEKFNWKEVSRFGLFGSLWVAPTVYTWIKTSSKLFPAPNLQNALKKAIVEQFTYCPFAITTFYTGMNLLQGRSMDHATNELREKFWPTYQTGALYWVSVQTLNFAMIIEKNRVPVMSVASLVWGTFLSYMKFEKVWGGK
uniref:Mpv17-like protein n=1 Tax=Strigamia maritima TaxID=126957 RepID=T1IQ56_STRMM